MRPGPLICTIAALLTGLAGCPGGSGGIGDHCGDNGDCGSSLQCLNAVCAPRCTRAPDCGDGFSCTQDGLCKVASGQLGDPCASEVDCAAGLACRFTSSGLVSTCDLENDGAPPGAPCATDDDCRNGTCALGHCVDHCAISRDCAENTTCATMPRLTAGADPVDQGPFQGCLQSIGTLSWTIPIAGPNDDGVLLPIPDIARSVAVTFAVTDPDQKVGATHIVAPDNMTVLLDSAATYYTDPVRHQPLFGQSVLVMPSTPTTPLVEGSYHLIVKSLKELASGMDIDGTATPTMTAVIKVDISDILDLHFYFLNSDEHPCADQFGGGPLTAARAEASQDFQSFVLELKALLATGSIQLGSVTYEDLPDHPDLDELDISHAGVLLSLGAHAIGINVFFVRALSPAGLQAYSPGPGPAGLAGTPQSGIVIGLDTLCYRPWSQQDLRLQQPPKVSGPALSHVVGHEIARYMGLYDNVEVDYNMDSTLGDPTHQDPISDSDTTPQNLMWFSDLGSGTDLSIGQRDILGRSAVLR